MSRESTGIQFIFFVESHESTVWSCDFSPDGTKLISCSEDKTLKVWMEDENSLGNLHSN